MGFGQVGGSPGKADTTAAASVDTPTTASTVGQTHQPGQFARRYCASDCAFPAVQAPGTRCVCSLRALTSTVVMLATGASQQGHPRKPVPALGLASTPPQVPDPIGRMKLLDGCGRMPHPELWTAGPERAGQAMATTPTGWLTEALDATGQLVVGVR